MATLDWPQANTIHVHWLLGDKAQHRQGLYRVLAAYLGCSPPDVAIAPAHAGGKPQLVGARGLRFNWSHTREIAVAAVAHETELGIDIEYSDRNVKSAALAQRYFTAAEQALIGRFPAARRSAVFLRLWTGKEAVLKALGLGLSGGIDRVELRLDSDSGLRLSRLRLDPVPETPIHLHELAVPRQNLLASLCWSGGPQRLLHFCGVRPMPPDHLHAPLRP